MTFTSRPNPRPNAIIFALCAFLAGCSPHPWVKPYEQDALNDPLLRFKTDPLIDQRREKSIAIRQGARGAAGVPGDGCKCE